MTVEANKNNDEAAIKRVIEGYVEAVHAKDLAGMVSIYAPELVVFNIVPKLALRGSRDLQEPLARGVLVDPGPVRGSKLIHL